MPDEISLERIIPDRLNMRDVFDRATLQLHRERYAFAIRWGHPGSILDIACGTGYGSYQMIQSEKFSNSRITAVDIASDAVDYGKNRYAHPAIEFICANAMEYSTQKVFDTIVSLETIEHLKDPPTFITILHSLLKKDGIIIVSAPVTPSTDGNPHHLSDFTSDGFKKLFDDSYFAIIDQFQQVQSYSIASLFRSKNRRLTQTRHHLGRFYLQNPRVLFARIGSLFRDGFSNKYLTLALRKR